MSTLLTRNSKSRASSGQASWRLIYLIGGAPRAGKSILAQQVAAKLKIGWISTDLLVQVIRVNNDALPKAEWNATPEHITATAEWFYPYLDRFVWGVDSMADSYLIEGVGFLPAQVEQLAAQYPVRSVFLGCAKMTFERFDQFPGRSRGYAMLPEAMRRQFAQDIPGWSAFIRQAVERAGYPYIDMSDHFPERLSEAERLLTFDAPA